MIPLGVLAQRQAAPSGGVVISDDFNRANGNSLGANWITISGALAISSNMAVRGPLLNAASHHATPLTSPDHYCAVYRTGGSGDAAALVRCAGGTTQTYYMGRHMAGLNQWEIYRRVSGSFTLIGSASETNNDPVTVRLEAEGSTLRLYGNGVLKVTVTDSTIPGGLYAGLRLHDSSSFGADNFEAGDL